MIDFKLPELGENVATGDVMKVLVAVGETITSGQSVLELETDKATVEVPSSVSGRVREIGVKPGDVVRMGQIILSVDAESAGDETPAASATITEAATMATFGEKTHPGDGGEAAPGVSPLPEEEGLPQSRTRELPSAAPSVRRLAREFGVDLAQVTGSGVGGRIMIGDVQAYAKTVIGGTPVPPMGALTAERLPDFGKWGEIERQPMRAVRRKTARHLSAAWTTIPHVTQHDQADITELEETRGALASHAEAAGAKLTITAILVKVVASALKVFPQFNASIDMANEQIILKKYVHVGVAVATDRGLLVPVIRDADSKNVIQLALELKEASERAHTKKTTLEEMEGGSFTITNLGGLGGTYFSPIINVPEVAILGVSRASTQPVFVDGTFKPRLMLPLSLSYDHRLIDGAEAIRFLHWIIGALEQPFLLTLEGPG